MSGNSRHYEALLAEADRVGWPEQFRTDLTVHDRTFLASRDPALPFAWVLGRGATYLVYPGRRPIDGAGHRAEDMPACCAHSFGRENCRWYWWDGRALRELPSASALSAQLVREVYGDDDT